MATFKAVIFTGGKHLKQDGTTNIKIRIYHNGIPQYIPTDYYVKPDYMGDDGFIISSADNSEGLNYELGEILQKYRGICIKLGVDKTRKMTCSELKEEIEKLASPDPEYIDFVGFSKELIAKTVKIKTAKWLETSLNAFINYYGKEKISANDINIDILEDYMEHLSAKKIGKNTNKTLQVGSINNYMRGLRYCYNKARTHFNNKRLNIIKIPDYPFEDVSIPEYTKVRKNIRLEDVIAIRDAEFDRERTNMARDVFMMMFYMMGINANDLFKIQREQYGRINYERSKEITINNVSRMTLSIRVEPELRILIDKYSKGGSFLNYFHARYSDYNNFLKAVNKELKVIAEELKLGVPLSTNWARHSWATIARNKARIAKADVDFCLGHVSNDYKMADIYIDIDYSICDRANRSTLDLLKEKTEKKIEYSLAV